MLHDLRSNTGLREIARSVQVDPSYLSKVEHGLVPINSRMIASYVERAGLDQETVDLTTDILEMLCGRAPSIPPDLARPLAEIWHIMKRQRRTNP